MFSRIFNRTNLKLVLGILGIANGGTGSSTASGARTNLNVYSKAEVDAIVVGLFDDRGNYDASVNTFPTSGGSGSAGAILKGDIWTISVAGTLGGKAVEIGDTVRALVDSPSQTASNWATMQANYGDAITNTIFRPKTVIETLSGTRTLTATEAQEFYFNPNGADRIIKMYASPAIGDTRYIHNTGNAGNYLTIQNNDGSAISNLPNISNGVGFRITQLSTGWILTS